MQSVSCETLDWMNHMLEWRVPGERSTTSCVHMIPLNGRKWRRTEEPLDESGRNGKTALKLNIQNTKSMASRSITSWQTEKWRHWQILFSWAPKSLWIGDCSHEIKRYLLLRRKTVTNLDSILKNRDINLLTKVCIVKAMVSISHVQMSELDYKESWAPKNWCFQIAVLEKTLERSNQSILKEINTGYSLGGLKLGWSSNTLAAWCEEPTHWKRPCMLRKIEDRRRRKLLRTIWLDSIASLTQWSWTWANSGR